MKTPRKRWFFSSLVLAAVLGLSACAGPQVADYAAEKPVLDLRQYFNGTVDAYGLFTDRSGRVVKRFTVVMTCSWQGPPGREVGVLDEEFTYADGSRQRRVWTLTRQADVLIAAIGRPEFVTADMVKPGAVVIDVGMNRNEAGKLCGDVDFEGVRQVAGHITPVPGGVGPMTIAMLLVNTLESARRTLSV